MSGAICALAGGGGVSYSGSTTVTVGFYDNGTNGYFYGFLPPFAGSVSPTTWASTGAAISWLSYVFYYGSPSNEWVQFSVAGSFPNEGWTTMTVGSTPLLRVNAQYSTDGATYTQWIWFNTANAFGTSGTKVVTWS